MSEYFGLGYSLPDTSALSQVKESGLSARGLTPEQEALLRGFRVTTAREIKPPTCPWKLHPATMVEHKIATSQWLGLRAQYPACPPPTLPPGTSHRAPATGGNEILWVDDPFQAPPRVDYGTGRDIPTAGGGIPKTYYDSRGDDDGGDGGGGGGVQDTLISHEQFYTQCDQVGGKIGPSDYGPVCSAGNRCLVLKGGKVLQDTSGNVCLGVGNGNGNGKGMDTKTIAIAAAAGLAALMLLRR